MIRCTITFLRKALTKYNTVGKTNKQYHKDKIQKHSKHTSTDKTIIPAVISNADTYNIINSREMVI